ncbi:HlyD family efflux transporter periplasmic adaptor subunit [Chroococcidiopsis sp.]|uniref:HlyD family efflux transporter periplasmic adaptor subunit n=1 Tax=Chroococcidiopsis sp. TaxID=3088168 RepID=UPI003F3D902E
MHHSLHPTPYTPHPFFNRATSRLRLYALRIAILSCWSLCVGCGSIRAQNGKPETPSASPKAVTRVVALGKLIPAGDVTKISVFNAEDSRVNQILVQEGDFVWANQTIAILQGRDRLEQQLRNARANVVVKQAQLLKIQQGDAKTGEIAAQRAAIAELEARLRSETKQKAAAIAEVEATLSNAKLRQQRNLFLWQQGAIGRSELDNTIEEMNKAQAVLAERQADADNTRSTLQAQLVKERANLFRLQEVRPVDVKIAQAELEQAIIQVQERQAELDDTQVRVPVAGQILRINTRVGERVNVEEGIAELGRTKQMYVLAEVYETDIGKVRLEQAVTVSSEYGGFSGELRGEVAQIGFQVGKTRLNQDDSKPTTDVNARVVEVKIRLNPEDSSKVAAFTGMQVRVRIDVN